MAIGDRWKKATEAAKQKTKEREDEPPKERKAVTPGATAGMRSLYADQIEGLERKVTELLEKIQKDDKDHQAEILALRETVEASVNAGAFRVPLSQVSFKPGSRRKRTLTAQEFDGLKASMEIFGQIHSIVVEKEPNGSGYWIVAGHNRYEVATALGWETVRIEIGEHEGEMAEIAAFISNLLQPELPTSEVYENVRRLMNDLKMTASDIAKATGLSKSYLSMVNSLSKAPESVRNFVIQSNIKMGASMISDVVKLSTTGSEGEELTLKALRRMENKEGSWKDEVQKIENALKAPAADATERPKVQVKPFMIGRAKFADMRYRGKAVSVEFKEEMPVGFIDELSQLIEKWKSQ